MKEYSNIETNSLKIRGKFNDQIVTDGGFYSGQLGEVAYKSEVPLGPSYFYGLTIKTSNNDQSWDAINTISFDKTDFYLQHTSADTVKVMLRREARSATRSADFDVATVNATVTSNTTPDNFVPYYKRRIAANELKSGKTIKITLIGTAVRTTSAGTAGNNTIMMIGGKKVIDSTSLAYASNANFQPLYHELFLMQQGPDSINIIVRLFDGPRVNAVDFGDLATDATALHSIAMTGPIPSRQDQDRTLFFYFKNTAAFTGNITRRFAKTEFLN